MTANQKLFAMIQPLIQHTGRHDFNWPPGLCPIEFCCEGKKYPHSPLKKTFFFTVQGGIRKTTIMRNIVGNPDDETVYLYIPLNQYRYEIHEKFMPESCNILVSILLKYHYQYEY